MGLMVPELFLGSTGVLDGRDGPVPELEKPAAGSLLPNLNFDSDVSAVDCRFPLLASVEGVKGRGVPGAVLLGVAFGLASFEGG